MVVLRRMSLCLRHRVMKCGGQMEEAITRTSNSSSSTRMYELGTTIRPCLMEAGGSRREQLCRRL